jgi:hypothetical protein
MVEAGHCYTVIDWKGFAQYNTPLRAPAPAGGTTPSTHVK